MITLLDYGAGNVRSVVNAIEKSGHTVYMAASGDDIARAEKLVFPGVGNFSKMMEVLGHKGFIEPLLAYLLADKPFLGICLGLHALFEKSHEAPGISGLGFLATDCTRIYRRATAGTAFP
ncbi:MAG: glutamine amidotransferase-related protein [Desulfosalsimonas sp.]